MQLSSSTKLALGILAAVLLYFAVRAVFNTAPEAAASEADTTTFTVLVEDVAPQAWRDTVVVRGRTEAERKVVVRAETAGVVAETPIDAGAKVAAGDLICKLNVDARRAAVTEARASLAKAKLDYDAAKKLAAEGFRSETSLAGVKAALDLARANVEQAEVNYRKTSIAAPFDGVFDQRMVEVGDFLSPGDPCGVVIQRSPFLVVGALSEKDVAKVSKGDKGRARLATGEIVEGAVKFVSTAADPATRTFRIELAVPNEEGALRDGVTAEFEIFTERRTAHLVPRSTLVLNDEGVVGIRTVGDDNQVAFTPIRLIGEAEDGVWIAGAEGLLRLITRGQSFVSDGQEVSVSHADPAA